MNLGKKYLEINNKGKNEHFGLFKIREINLDNLEKFTTSDTTSDATHWMFNKNGLRKYDDNGIALFDNNGIQILNIDENGINVPLNKVLYNFNGINDIKFVKKNYENNKNINSDTVDKSISKIFNNISNNVVQNNLADAAASSGAMNSMTFSNIHCKNLTISNFSQYANADATVISKVKQISTSNISTNISNNIEKTIHDVSSNNFGQYSDENKIAATNVASMFGLGTDTDSGISVALSLGNNGLFATDKANSTLNSTISNTLSLDNSIVIKSENNIQNIIKNTISQNNVAVCVANAAAANIINFNDILCTKNGSLTIQNGNQTAIASALANCTFDQQNSVTINNTIKTNVSSGFNQVYDELLKAIEKKYGIQGSNNKYGPKNAESAKAAYKEYYAGSDKIDALGRLHADILNTVGCATTDKSGVITTVNTDCVKALTKVVQVDNKEEAPPKKVVPTPTPTPTPTPPQHHHQHQHQQLRPII